ncbi:hypothetical protein D3C83_162970 [compost metagenome]
MRRAFGLKDSLDLCPQIRLIVLERQDVIGPLFPDLLGDLFLRPHGIDRHDAAFDKHPGINSRVY